MDPLQSLMRTQCFKRSLKRMLFIPMVILHFALIGQVSPEPELAGIKATLLDYIEGTAKGQPARLRKAFHPDFNLYTVNDSDSLWIRDGEAYIGYFKEGKSNNRIGRILDIDYEGNAATAKVEITVPGWRVFTDYFLLLNYLGDWKIVHKSYSWRDIVPADENAHLDSIFASVDRPNHPAVVALALHKGEVVYKRAFGSSNLTHKIPTTVNTQFELSTMSRQFTAFAILLLEQQGRLSLSDDIRKYLPSLPVYDEVITIDHLLSTSSGLSDIWPMLEMQGITDEDVVTQEEALSIIRKLDPVFTPGEDYIYGHTDQVLLAEIVAKASGKGFMDFMEEDVFLPLDMTGTKIKDAEGTGLNNMAEHYLPTDSGFRKTNSDLQLQGPINVYSTADDLAKWELNLLNPRVGNEQLIQKLFTSCRTNDGSTMYALRG
ncbi:MAG: serine hydrolase, partial [Bacteroidota bacterium]